MVKIVYRIYDYFKFKKKGYPENPVKISKILNESQYWTRKNLEEYQLDKLNSLLLCAKENSDYYSNSLKNVDLPLCNISEFKNIIPIIKKNEIIEYSNLLKSKFYSNKYRHTTSGSSGDPLSVYISGMAEAYRKAGSIRFKSWWNIKPYDKSVLIWRYDNKSNGNIVNRVKRFFLFRYNINVYSLSDTNIKKYFDYIEKYRPAYIRGYTSGILEFAELLKKHNLKFNKAKFKVVITTAENLFEDDRKFIENVFNCKVANEFGSAEAGLFAYECPSGSMHIFEEANYIYTDDISFAHITEFFNNSMPLINYKNDDKIVISDKECNCGRSLRVIDDLIGRESGYIRKTDGTKLNQGILISIFIGLNEEGFEESVKKFKIVQKGNEFRIFIVPLNHYNKKVENHIKDKMYSEIGNNIKIKFILKDKIEREKSGKLRYFVREDG